MKCSASDYNPFPAITSKVKDNNVQFIVEELSRGGVVPETEELAIILTTLEDLGII